MRLARESRVLSRDMSLIALENDAMFREYGIARGAHRPTPPKLRMGMTMVSGRMPAESIRRVMRQNYGRFRGCYHRGLLRNPSLEGRVVLRFVIGRDGNVIDVRDGGSQLADDGVV